MRRKSALVLSASFGILGPLEIYGGMGNHGGASAWGTMKYPTFFWANGGRSGYTGTVPLHSFVTLFLVGKLRFRDLTTCWLPYIQRLLICALVHCIDFTETPHERILG